MVAFVVERLLDPFLHRLDGLPDGAAGQRASASFQASHILLLALCATGSGAESFLPTHPPEARSKRKGSKTEQTRGKVKDGTKAQHTGKNIVRELVVKHSHAVCLAHDAYKKTSAGDGK